MGNNLQKVNGSEIAPLAQIYDEYLGPSQLFSVKNRKRAIIKTEIKSNLKDFHSHIKLSHPNLSKTWNYDSDLSEVFGQTQGTSFYLDFYETPFTKIVFARKQRNQFFTLAEVLKVACCMLEVLSYLQWNNVAHGDLNPGTVFYDKDRKQVVLYDNELLFGKHMPYRKWINGKPTYMTPEALQAIRSRNPQKLDGVRCQSDIYLLALFLLELCTMESSIFCCNRDALQMDRKVIEGRMKTVHQKYGQTMVQLLGDMLQEDPYKRPAAKALLERFINHPTELPKQFVPQQPPINIPVKVIRLQTEPSFPIQHKSMVNLQQLPQQQQLILPKAQHQMVRSQVFNQQQAQNMVQSVRLSSPGERTIQSQITSPVKFMQLGRAQSPQVVRSKNFNVHKK